MKLEAPEGNAKISTYFLPPERADGTTLARVVGKAAGNPVIDQILRSVGGLVAVLNRQRQILALNHAALSQLGISDTGKVLGLRLGEALQCIYSAGPPAGCGTTEHCRSCGAAIAMASALASEQSVEEKCSVTIERAKGRREDLQFLVRASPLLFDGDFFILIFMRDTTVEAARAVLERTFLHDISNTIGMLGLLRDSLRNDATHAELVKYAGHVRELSDRLEREVLVQKILANPGTAVASVDYATVAVDDVLRALRELCMHHSAAAEKNLEVTGVIPGTTLTTHRALLERVLANMLINALEATPPGGTVRLSVFEGTNECVFSVWNSQAIPDEIVHRIFHRNYSTKASSGRGLGTFSMRLLGEKYLQGRVWFTSSPERGTTFYLSLPIAPAA